MAYERVDELRQRSADMEDKLSFGTYFVKQLRTIGITFGSMAVGTAVAFGISRAIGKPRVIVNDLQYDSSLIGTFLGGILGGYFTTYEHWAKNEATNLAVAEINQDIAQARLRLDPELKRENTALREMIKQQDQALQARGNAPTSPSPRPEIAAETAQSEGQLHDTQHALSA